MSQQLKFPYQTSPQYDQYDLFKATDEHITKPRFHIKQSEYFYPSEASVVTHDHHGDKVVHGGCHRASYFRLTGEEGGTPNEARSEYIFAQGIAIEKFLITLWKEMGIWVDNNVRFYDKENNISGEVDVILAEPPAGKLYGLECKSFYGYMAEKEIFGNKGQKGFPKMNHLLQTLVYLNYFKDTLEYFRIAYFARDSVKRKTFKIELHKEGNILFPKVDGEVIRSFTIQDVIKRYQELAQYIQSDTIPPNDYELQYSNDKVEDFFKKGKIAKTKYEKWKKGKLGKYEYIGDWNCSYCGFKQVCWPNL